MLTGITLNIDIFISLLFYHKWNNMEVWTKPMGLDAKGMAFAFLNLDDGGGPVRVSIAVETQV